ncbi:phage tail tape measure protein [Deinococcus humi]|uniref:Phage-related minor tail protein n=1 Tax=Deinococcus humi TaxID=662880 RepID=A0A7W8JTR8_9DEIO|nr:phage tail tape measure protein [Deinococcus humi]MBB5363097.1 phage-related minor tail protein [Deinococcus humi]GGO24704.1 hypothetical protein GCM10008949_13890 [Deinococcus humi]
MTTQADVIVVDITGRDVGLEAALNQAEASAEGAGERAGSKFGNALKAGLGVATVGAVALVGALAAVGASSFNLATEAAQNVKDFESNLGATREEAEKLGTVAEQVFGDNWTGSLTEAGAAVATVRKEISGLADEDLRAVTGGVVAIAETFEQEQGSIAAAVDSLMKSTGISAQEATDFITKGFQKGLDSSGDFLDTLNEYAPQFEKSKIGAGELFSLLETGAGKGALGTDKIADAFKEFGLTIVDVSDDSKDVYKELGLNQEKLVKGINDGSISQAKAFEMVTNKLAEVKGQADRTRIGAAIFGGAGEDFANGLTKLDLTKTSIKDLGGATDSLNRRYENFSNYFSAMSRQIQVALLPVGKELLSLANDAMPYLQQAASWLGDRLPGWIKTGIDAVKQFGSGAINTYNTLKPVIGQVSDGVQKLSVFLERNKEILIPLTAGVAAGTAAFGLYRTALIVGAAAQAAWTTATTVATTASVAFRAAITFLTGPVGIAITIITALVAAGVYLYRNWDEVKAKAIAIWGAIRQVVMDAIGGALAWLRTVPGEMSEVAMDIIRGLMNGIKQGPRLILEAVKGLGHSIISGVKGVLGIRSPSTVMFDAGENVGQGLSNGITKTTPQVQKAAAGMSKAVISEVDKARAALEKDIRADAWVASLERATTAQLQHAQATARAAGDAEKYGAITTELTRRKDVATAATQRATDAAKAEADQLRQNRETIIKGEQQERYVEGLRSATAAHLASALATAKAGGEVDKYNAIKSEQARRENVATAATQKATDAAKAEADQLRQNRESILSSEQRERYVEGLRSATSAQLDSALATAKAGGEVDKYNAIRAEQTRRDKEVEDSTRKATEAAKAAADQLASNRKAITDGLRWGEYVEGLKGYSDDLLEAARKNALAAGDGEKFNVVLGEQKRRADEAAQALSALVDEQIREANSRYTDTKGAAESAERKGFVGQFGAGDVGLIKSLAAATGLSVGQIRADVFAALDDAKKFAPQAAAIIERVYADALAHRKSVTAEQARVMEQAAKDEEERIQRVLAAYVAAANERRVALEAAAAEEQRIEAATTARAVEMAGERRDQIVQTFRDETAAADDAAITFDFLNGLIVETVTLGGDPSGQLLDYLKNLATGSGEAAAAAQEVIDKFDVLVFRAQTPGPMDTTPVEARGTPVYEIMPEEPTAAGPIAPDLLGGRADAGLGAEVDALANLAVYRDEIRGLTDDELELAKADAVAAGERGKYNALLAEGAERAKLAADSAKLITDAESELHTLLSGETLPAYELKAQALERQAVLDEDQRVRLLQLADAIRAAGQAAAENADKLNVTLRVGGIDTGLKALDLYKSAIMGVGEVISKTFEDLVAGTGSGVNSILANMALMALGIVKQVATAIMAYEAQAIALALISGASFNFVQAGLALAAAAAVAGIVAGLESRVRGSGTSTAVPSPGAGGAPAPGAVAPPPNNSLVNIPNSAVTVVAAPEWTAVMVRVADKMERAADKFLDVAERGVRVRSTVRVEGGSSGGLGAFALTTP